MAYFIGVDIGGTFTDCVALSDEGRLVHAKTFSTTVDPAQGVLRGMERLGEATGEGRGSLLSSAARLSHGTTIGTNLVVERKGATVVLLTTHGHGDVLDMMRGSPTAGLTREQLFSLHGHARPRPLVHRDLVVEVHERMDAAGEVVAPLDLDGARTALTELAGRTTVDAVAISLLWSIKNAAHEEALAAMVREVLPHAFLSLSSQVAPRVGEYERTVATVLDAYVGPASTRYLDQAASSLADAGLGRPLLVMQSNGGVVGIDKAKDAPLRGIDSGPAGGLIGTSELADRLGHENVIGADMGGTSFDVGIILRGQPLWASERVIDQYTYAVPHLDVRSIACGGGSIARYDEHGRSLRVGPESAGSEPGPACYGRGGTEATVTDADVVLGLIGPDTLLGGTEPIDADAARAVVGRLAERVGLGLEETAAGIIRINNHAAATLIRQRTVEQGLDPRDFTIYAFGGAGPLHAFGFAHDLGVGEVVIPLANGASTLSAYGIASSDVVEHFEAVGQLTAPFDAAALAALVAAAEDEAYAALAAQGFDRDQVELVREVAVRYAEQYMQSVVVPLADGPVTDAVAEQLVDAFDAEYARLFGAGARVVFQAVEVFGVRVQATVPLAFARHRDGTPSGPTDPVGSRPVHWPSSGGWTDTPHYDGARLGHDAAIAGPAIVQFPHTNAAVDHGQAIRADGHGNLVLTLNGADR